jgi:hypothetical protein
MVRRIIEENGLAVSKAKQEDDAWRVRDDTVSVGHGFPGSVGRGQGYPAAVDLLGRSHLLGAEGQVGIDPGVVLSHGSGVITYTASNIQRVERPAANTPQSGKDRMGQTVLSKALKVVGYETARILTQQASILQDEARLAELVRDNRHGLALP